MIKEITNRIVKLLESKNYEITSMEKGTDGLFINSIAETFGGFNVSDNGFIYGEDTFKSYSLNKNLKKCIDINGINSKTVASMMAICCKEDTNSAIGVGITGIVYSDASEDDEIDYIVYYCINMPSFKVSGEIAIPRDLEYNKDSSARYQQQQYVVEEVLKKLEECLLDENSEDEESLKDKLSNKLNGKKPITKKVVLGVSLTTVTTVAMLITKSFLKNRKKK